MRRIFQKRTVTLIAAVTAAALALTGCDAVSGSLSEDTLDFLGDEGEWIDSDLIGSMDSVTDVRLQDDFAAAVNAEWKHSVGSAFSDTFQELSDRIYENKKTIVTDESAKGPEADNLRTYYALASDWDGRDKDGTEPLAPYISDIASIDSTEALYDFLADLDRNPMMYGPVFIDQDSLIQSDIHPENYCLAIGAPDMTLTSSMGTNELYFSLDSAQAIEMYESARNRVIYMLGRLGYSEDDAAKIFEGSIKLERKIAKYDNKEAAAAKDLEEYTFGHDEAMAVAKDFPLEKLLSGWGLNGAKDILIWPGYAKKLSKLCSRGNLEYMKDFLIVSYCLESSFYLDRESLEKLKEFTNSRLKEPIDTGETPEQEEMELMFDKYIGSTPMCGAMNRLYCEYFFDDECVGDLNSIVAEMFDSFEEMFNGEEWMSDEGKAACIEKLRAIRVHIAYQDFDSVDYSKLDIKSREEGGNFLEAYFDSKRFAALHIAERLGAPYDINYWDPIAPGLSTTVTNAAYNPSTNGIYIFAGVCEAPMYSLDMSYEEKLAGLGAVVGHEITHGFDNKGVLYDKDGIKNSDWMPAADQGMFVDRSEKVGQHVSTIKPFPGSGLYDGRKVTAELTADMGGMKVTLMMAKKHPGFDYDRYFRARASDWRTNVPIEVESSRLSQDPHPLNFLRINIPHQQFDEFYSTYNITENDRMYIEPGKRIAVW